MAIILQRIAAGLIVLALLLPGVAPAQSEARLDRFLRSQASQNDVNALLLLLLLHPGEDANEKRVVAALVSAGRLRGGFTSEAALADHVGEASLEFLIGQAAALAQNEMDDFIQLMLNYLKLMHQELREDRRISRTRVYAQMLRLSDGIERTEIESAAGFLEAWLEAMAESVRRLEVHLETLYEESFLETSGTASPRFRDLANALKWSLAQIVADSQTPPSAPSGSIIEQSDDDTAEGTGGGACLECDGL